jgi:hypothetical protein
MREDPWESTERRNPEVINSLSKFIKPRKGTSRVHINIIQK